MSLFSPFSKDVRQTSNTQNTDNSRVTTLTDALNTSITQNLAMTKADSRVYNSAWDAIDSFNTVNSFSLANIGGGSPSIPSLDFTGLRDLFASPAELADLINANKIDADPNANKYDFNFSEQSAGGNEFLKSVQGLVKDTWEGLANATTAAKPTDTTSNIAKYALIGIVALIAVLLLKGRRG